MTGVTVPPYGSASFAYDPTMRLASSGLQRFHRFQDDMLAEYYGSILVERMIPGAGVDETIGTMNRFGVRNWYYTDERGSNIATAGDAGTGTSQVAYDEYGKPGTTAPPRMGYTGQMLLITDKVYDYKNRMYHPGLGRFLQPDPIGYAGGMNLYAYVGGDPINWHDPSGTLAAPSNVTEELEQYAGSGRVWDWMGIYARAAGGRIEARRYEQQQIAMAQASFGIRSPSFGHHDGKGHYDDSEEVIVVTAKRSPRSDPGTFRPAHADMVPGTGVVSSASGAGGLTGRK